MTSYLIHILGEEASSKLAKVRAWVEAQRPDKPSYARAEPKPQHYQIGILITALDQIGEFFLYLRLDSNLIILSAYLLNLRGSDIPFNPLFHAYLFIGLKATYLFLEGSKVNEEVAPYLASLGVERRDYSDIWKFLRKREWGGEGKVIPHSRGVLDYY